MSARKEKDALIRRLGSAVMSGNVALVRQFLTEHPEYKDYSDASLPSLLHLAARDGNIEMMQFFLDVGLDINKVSSTGGDSALRQTITFERFEAAKFLLSRGADPNLDRTLFSATLRNPEALALEFVKLLVDHGTDIDRAFDTFGDDRITFTPWTFAIAHGKTEIADYLRSKGAVMPDEKPRPPATPETLSQEVVAYFEKNFGPVSPLALIEIVPTEPPIAVHVVRLGKIHERVGLFTRVRRLLAAAIGRGRPNRKCLTLFTTGMSEQAMTVPDGGEDFRFAELFIQLPAEWPLGKESLADPKHGWPIHWLRFAAKYPHQNDTWLGGPATIIANEDPPQSLAPNTHFTCVLLLAEESFTAADGRKVWLYRMVPLYTEERELELRDGMAALLNAFDRHRVPFVLDLERVNVGLAEG